MGDKKNTMKKKENKRQKERKKERLNMSLGAFQKKNKNSLLFSRACKQQCN